jgi:hypothetical protein
VVQRNLPRAKEETAGLAARFRTAEILKRIHCLEELRDNLNRNIHEALAIEVVFLTIFIATSRSDGFPAIMSASIATELRDDSYG